MNMFHNVFISYWLGRLCSSWTRCVMCSTFLHQWIRNVDLFLSDFIWCHYSNVSSLCTHTLPMEPFILYQSFYWALSTYLESFIVLFCFLKELFKWSWWHIFGNKHHLEVEKYKIAKLIMWYHLLQKYTLVSMEIKHKTIQFGHWFKHIYLPTIGQQHSAIQSPFVKNIIILNVIWTLHLI